ncbi:MAG TPA: TraB/GumN family protein [Gammaproteobacteria bacterium]|nr:TraB/GumN family protein [Gammaproteobacteria bacterium]
MSDTSQPVRDLCLDGAALRLFGTAHVSKASADAVAREIAEGDYDCVAVELCGGRHRALADPSALAKLDLFQVIREGQAPMITATLALGAFQARIAEQLGTEPGAEMRAAIDGAAARGIELALIDRDVGVTLKRIYRNVPWWKRAYLFSGLLASVLVPGELDADGVERLKQDDLLEATFAQFATRAPAIYEPLVAERDRYMAARIEQLVAAGRRRILVVIGAAHLLGMTALLQARDRTPARTLEALSAVPPPSRWTKALPWLFALFVVAGIGIGFARSPAIGWELVRDWIVYTGGLAALGTAIAAGHPLTIASAIGGAPLTTLHPAIGIGFVTALVEAWIRRPTVGDFTRLRADTAHWRGWWRNRVARTLLVFMLSSIGAAAGAYTMGFRIGHQLLQ